MTVGPRSDRVAVAGEVSSVTALTDEETRRLVANARTLDVAAVVPGRILLSAYLFHYPTQRFQQAAVLVDSGSEACLADPAFYGEPKKCRPIVIKGVHDKKVYYEESRSLLLTGEGVARRAIGIKVHSIGTISGGLVKLLLSATVAKRLGLISGELCSSNTPVERLPELKAVVDLFHVAATTLTGEHSSSSSSWSSSSAGSSSHGETTHASDYNAYHEYSSHCDHVDGDATYRLDDMPTYQCYSADWCGDPWGVNTRGTASVDAVYVSLAESLVGKTLGEMDLDEAYAHLADAMVGKSMERQDNNPFPDRPTSLDDIAFGVNCSEEEAKASGLPNLHIGGTLSIAQVRRVKALFEEINVFGTSRTPAPVNHPPVDINLQPDEPGPGGVRRPTRPVHLPPPTMSPNTHKYFWLLRQDQERQGLLKKNPHSRWATYTHLTGKAPYDDDGVPAKLRDVCDRRPINQRTVPMRYVPSDGRAELERAACPSPFRFSTDALSAFNGFVLTPAASEISTMWLPKGPNVADGYEKCSPSRMGFGWCNAPAVQGAFYDDMKNNMQQHTQDQLCSHVDDFMLSADQREDRDEAFEDWLLSIRDFLTQLKKANVQLNAPKSRLGFRNNNFWGFTVTEYGGSSLSDRNVAVIRALPHPKNVHELQTVLGFLGFVRNYCKDYSDKAAPLFELTKKGVKFDFTDVHKAAFENLRAHLVNSTRNYRPDYDYQLVLESDASDTAIGARLYQHYQGVDHNISFFSRTLSAAERRLSVPMRECIALVEGIAWSRIYALSSPLPLLCLTDHHALQFMAHIDKGSLSASRFAAVGDVNYEVRWIPGRRNNAADFLSRLTTAGPQQLTQPGIIEAVDKLLHRLGDQHRDAASVWVWAQKDSSAVARVVQRWRRRNNPVTVGSTQNGQLHKSDWQFAVLIPSPLTAAADTAALLRSGRPGAVLLPADLLLSVVDSGKGEHDDGVAQSLHRAKLMSFPLVNQIWVVQDAEFDSTVVLAVDAELITATTPSHHYNTRGRATAAAPAAAARAPPAAPRGGTSLPISPVDTTSPAEVEEAAAARRDSERSRLSRMQIWELKRELEARNASSKGQKVDLLARLTLIVLDELTSTATSRAADDDDDSDDDVPENSSSGGQAARSEPTPRSVIDTTLEALGSTAEWPRQQQEDDCPRRNRLRREADGMLLFAQPGQAPLVVVPARHRRKLMRLVHEELGHHTTDTAAHLAKHFYWRTLRADCKEYTDNCVGCVTTKRRVVHLHGLYRNLQFFGPGLHYAMDLKRWGAGEGRKYLLGVVDRWSGFLILCVIADKTAASVIGGLLQHVVYVHGQPASLACDSEKAFVSTEVKAWCDKRGTRILRPLAYSATGHSPPEVAWQRIVPAGRRLRRFPGTDLDVAEIAWEYNLATKAGTTFPPFTLQYGRPAVTVSQRVAEARRVLGVQIEAPAAAEELLECAAAVRSMATARGNNTRRAAAVALNAASPFVLRPLPVGQRVYYYAPQHKTAGSRNKEYCNLYTGPATVAIRMSNVGYMVRNDKTGALSYRHRQHIRPVDMEYVEAGEEDAGASL